MDAETEGRTHSQAAPPEPTPGRTYRHFKGNVYQVQALATYQRTRDQLFNTVYQGLARHTETQVMMQVYCAADGATYLFDEGSHGAPNEPTAGERFVLYRGVPAKETFPWARPTGSWTSAASSGGPRFTEVS